jgi:signal recognition particle receptor subunit beta
MRSGLFSHREHRSTLPSAVKIVIAGHFGVGKTTMVSTVSEIAPLRTEEVLTDAGEGVDDVSGVESKTTTTVAMDFGRITIHDDLVLYLFGTPGQARFSFIWDELSVGAIGAVVLADTRRLDETFSCIDYFEANGTPFVVAVNRFEGSRVHSADEVRLALDLDPGVPLLMCDARDRTSCKTVLMGLVEHVIGLRRRQRVAPA